MQEHEQKLQYKKAGKHHFLGKGFNAKPIKQAGNVKENLLWRTRFQLESSIGKTVSNESIMLCP